MDRGAPGAAAELAPLAGAGTGSETSGQKSINTGGRRAFTLGQGQRAAGQAQRTPESRPCIPQVKLLVEPELSPFPSPGRAGACGEQAQSEWPDLEVLVREFFTEVHGLLVRLVGRGEEAEDLAQECFVRVERARREARGDESGPDLKGDPRAYLLRSAANLAKDWYRRRGRRGEVSELPESVTTCEPGPASAAEDKELNEALRMAVAALPDPPRSSFIERVLLGREYSEVARSLGIGVGTVRIQVVNARKRLRRSLAAFLEEGS